MTNTDTLTTFKNFPDLWEWAVKGVVETGCSRAEAMRKVCTFITSQMCVAIEEESLYGPLDGGTE